MVKRILYILAVLLSIVACSDEIDKSNRYTFTGETVADYLLNRSDRYSHFISLLKRAELLSLLQTYGQYTLFLPDDAAIEKYVQEQDSIYQEYKDTDTPIWTGITSPLVDEVSDSMARVITRTHLLEGRYMTAQFGEGALTKWNMNDRYLGVNYRGSDEGFYIVINNYAVVVGSDNEVENGVVHMVDRVIDSSVEEVPVMIAKQPFFSIFAEALDATGFADSLFRTMDLEYSPKNYSTSETYPPFRFYKYTGFIEPDEVFRANGINNLTDLKAFAEKWYGTEDSDSLQSPRNALYRFVAYHFLDRELPYDKLVITKYYDDNYYYPRFDLYDYFEMANGKMMKITKPLSTVDGGSIFLNYSKRDVPYNFEMRKHLNVRVLETTEFTQSNERYANFRQYASNGIIHPIDKILVYNEEEMAGNILNERMRIDIVSLLPELSCNNIRFADITMQFIPFDYCKNLKNNAFVDDFQYYRMPHRYLNDEIAMNGMFDFSVKLPPVPARTYEIRMDAYLQDNWAADIIQVYLDDKICGLPISMRLSAKDPVLGWEHDYLTDDNGVELDKQMRNRGWMKAPDSYLVYSIDGPIPARNSSSHVRRIITSCYLSEGEHWLRIRKISDINWVQDMMKNTSGYDYIELVPLHIVSDPNKPEDRH